MTNTLTANQQEVLRYLHLCEHSTRNIMRRMFVKPPTTTLLSLEKKGFVTHENSSDPLSRNVRWTITTQGHDAARAFMEAS